MYILRALTYSICDDLFKEISQAKFHFENELFMIQTIKCSKNLNEKRKWNDDKTWFCKLL